MISNESKLYHEYLIRLDDELSTKLVHFSKENEMKYTGVIRKSLRQFFENELQKEVKRNDKTDENRNQ
jgi:predicted transcriptional regulator